MRSLVVVVVVVAVGGAVACGRANPRVKKLTRTQGNDEQVTRFEYDDNGQPSSVEQDFGSGVSQEYTFTFDGGNVKKMKLTHRAGGGETVDESEMTYDDQNRLSKVKTDIGDSTQTVTVTLDYDESGNMAKVVRKTAFGNGDNVEQTELSYKDGVVSKVEITSTFEIAGQAANSTVQTLAPSYQDGKVDEIDVDNDNDNTGTLSVTYKDGALDKIEFEGKQDGRDVTGKATYDYDNGLLSGAVLSNSQEQDDLEFAVDYDDGNAADVDMTPREMMNGLAFWDLRGASYGTLDVHTQALRLAGASW